MENTHVLRTQSTSIGRVTRNLAVWPAVGLLVLAASSQGAAAQQPMQEKQAAEETHASGGPHEGIKVHGHWVIEVRNPDGSFASRTEFENSLVPSDASPFLSKLLARKASVGSWAISLAGTGGPCMVIFPIVGLAPGPCVFFEPALVPSVIGDALQLAGTTTVTQNGTIAAVATLFRQCDVTIDPVASCPNEVDATFTSRTLATAQPVTAGQLVQVTVTINFN